MVIGRGAIASIINDRSGFIFYANGASNRKPLTQNVIDKEIKEVLSYSKSQDMFVYFSGLNIYYKDGGRKDYTEFKLMMEELVKKNFTNYCIFRIGSITWGDNPNTIVNYLKNNPLAELKDVYRYLHTKEELQHWMDLIPEKGKHEMNVTGRMIKPIDILKEIKDGKL